MIKNRAALRKFVPEGSVLLDLAEEALDFLQPANLMQGHIKLRGQKLTIQNRVYDLKKFENVYIVGAGKATFEMTRYIYKLIPNQITSGFINVPKAYTKSIGPIKVNAAGHPYPTIAGVRGAEKIMKLLQGMGPKDLVICLMSGGGSALLPLPAEPLTLADKQKITDKLLKCSADIKEINTVRKHISQIKGGRLAQVAMPATLVSLYISDVVGDDLNTIASGPTVPDPTSSQQAIAVLDKYQIKDKKVRQVIKINESPKELHRTKVKNVIVGNNAQVLKFIELQAEKRGLRVLNLTSELQGEASEVARTLILKAKKLSKSNSVTVKPILVLAGGETTVTVKGKGRGGRNQELALNALSYLTDDMVLLSLATDGVDGITPTPIAGAIVGKKVKNTCINNQISIDAYLAKNDSYTCLSKIGCLLKTGPTGTNVGDIIMILINK